jgi:hypothetical protein
MLKLNGCYYHNYGHYGLIYRRHTRMDLIDGMKRGNAFVLEL